MSDGAARERVTEASMRLTSWDGLATPDDVLARVLEALSPEDRRRVLVARNTTVAVPDGMGHHGVGGEALARWLSRLLADPGLERIESLAILPVRIAPTESPAAHRVLEMKRLSDAWPGRRDDAYRAEVERARRAVSRGAPSAEEHQRWLEHFLLEHLAPAAERLCLPVQITWPGRADAADGALTQQLDATLSSWLR